MGNGNIQIGDVFVCKGRRHVVTQKDEDNKEQWWCHVYENYEYAGKSTVLDTVLYKMRHAGNLADM